MKKYKLYVAILTIFLLFTTTTFASNEITTNNAMNSENVIDDNSLIKALEQENSNETSEDQEIPSEDSNEEVLKEGIYKIKSILADDRLVEIPDSNRNQRTYFKLGTEETTANEKFRITKNTDGTYRLTILHTQKCMDVENGKAGNSVKVWQYNNNDTDAQKWDIIKNEDGTYSFISKLGNYALDVSSGKTAVGTNLQIFNNKGTDSQKFILEECSKEKGTQTIEDGTYKIITFLNTSKAIELSEELKLNDILDSTNQKFEFKYDGNGYYKIFTSNSNKVLSVDKDNTKKLYEAEDEDLDTQKWIVKKQDNVYNIVSKYSNLYLDLTNGSTESGTKLQIYRQNDSDAQKFQFISMEQILEEGIYNINSVLAENRLIEIPESNKTKKAYFKLGTEETTANEKFKISYNADGTYTLSVLHSQLCMDVENGKAGNRVKVWQYTSNASDAQKWYIIKNSDNTYSFISKLGNYALDVNNGKSTVGTDLQIYRNNGSDSQKFELVECSKEKGTQLIEDSTYRIITKANRSKALTLTNGEIELAEDQNIESQKYEFKYDGDGYYKIYIPNTTKVLTVDKDNTKRVYEAEDENLDTQKWIVKKQETVYNIVSKYSNLYLDITNGKTDDGTKLQIYRQNDSESQKFVLVNLTPTKDIVTDFENGIYQIVLTNGNVIDVDSGSYSNKANIQTWENDKVQQQKFRIQKIERTKYYRITAIHSAKSLDVPNGSCKIGTNVQQYAVDEDTPNQQWYLKDAGDGYYNIISIKNGLYVDVSGGVSSKNGQNIQLWSENGTSSQKFKLKAIDIINEGTYEIETKLDSDMVLDVSNASKNNYANIQIWEADNVNQQKFTLTALTNEEYKIIAKHSNKALTAQSDDNVEQYTYNGTDNQKWIIKEVGNGYYNLISKRYNLVLDVDNAGKSNGTNVQVHNSNGTDAQAFRFVTGNRIYFKEGTYGDSGLVKKGDKRGTDLKYYKFGKGDKVYFATFSIHGFEDSYAHDGEELTYIAEEFKDYLKENDTGSLLSDWTIYIFPNLNPDGQTYGTTNNGPGRTTLYSSAPSHKGIDMNRNWSTGYTQYSDNRNYNGTAAFQAYEAKALRDFLLDHQGTENVLVDLHGWLNETIGDTGIGKYYRSEFGMSTHIPTYGRGYLVNWARSNLKKGRSCLVELPEVTKHSQVVSRKYATKYIDATIKMLNNI